MPRRLRPMLIVLAVIVLTGLVAWGLYIRGGPVVTRSLPNPNGYDDFLKAGAAIVGDVSSAPTLKEDALSELVSTNSEALRVAKLGLTRDCSAPADTVLTNMTDLTTIKSLGLLLAAEGRLAEMQGRPLEAANSYLGAVQLGNNTSHGGLLIHRLVGIAVERAGYAGLLKVGSKLDCAEAKSLIERLSAIDERRVDWKEVMEMENRFARAEAKRVRNPLLLITAWWQSRAAIKKARERHDQMVARLRLLIVELGLRCYRAEHGVAPPRLDPAVVERVPLDPFTEQPLIYRSRGTNWLLYSVGADTVDNGGTPIGRSVAGTPTKGDMFFDSPF